MPSPAVFAPESHRRCVARRHRVPTLVASACSNVFATSVCLIHNVRTSPGQTHHDTRTTTVCIANRYMLGTGGWDRAGPSCLSLQSHALLASSSRKPSHKEGTYPSLAPCRPRMPRSLAGDAAWRQDTFKTTFPRFANKKIYERLKTWESTQNFTLFSSEAVLNFGKFF